MNSFISTPFRYSLVLLISALLVSGCSSSSDNTDSVGSQTPSEVVAEDGVVTEDGTGGSANEIDDATTGDTTSGSSDESTDGIDEPTSGTDTATTSEGSSTTLINFDITVPAVMSDALQVRLAWGDIDSAAIWNRDELWTASVEFPLNTTNQLLVTFSDSNGALTLGSFEVAFGIDENMSESFQITAGDFDTEQWDSDGDSVSNIEELIAGSDPVSSDTNVDINPVPTETLLPVSASIELIADKTFRITWQLTSAAEFYRVLENPDGVSGFTAVSSELDASTEFYDHRVGLHKRVNARYMVEACNSEGCTLSAQQLIEGNLVEAIGYLKASNSGTRDHFGSVVSISGDGNTLAVSAQFEDSAATGVNGDQSDESADASGAVYIFTRSSGGWQQQAYIKASNTDETDEFGGSVSLSVDGNTLVVGASRESSAATGIDGDQDDNSSYASGAVYVYGRSGDSWQQQAYLKAGNSDVQRSNSGDEFGASISLSADGNTLAVGARDEARGAVYIFVRSSGIWQQQANINASRSEAGIFGLGVSLSADGNVLAVSAQIADARGVFRSSAVFMFVRASGNWQEETFIGDLAGTSRVHLSGSGNTLAVADVGSAVIFDNIDGSWQEQARFEQFGRNGTLGFETDGISLSADGNTLAVGNRLESTRQTGLQGFQGTQPRFERAGAAYVFTRGDGAWQQEVYVKASNTSAFGAFGVSVSLSANGDTLAVGAHSESGISTGFNGDQTQDTGEFGASGAVYLY